MNQLKSLFNLFERLVQISKDFFIQDCFNFIDTSYVSIASTLPLELQSVGFEFILFMLKSVTFKEFLEMKMLKVIERLVIERPFHYTLWAIFNLSSCESIKSAIKSILDRIDVSSVETIHQLALLKKLG